MIYLFLKLSVGKKGKFKTLNALDGKKELKSITLQISFEGENECAERKFFFHPPWSHGNLSTSSTSLALLSRFRHVTSFKSLPVFFLDGEKWNSRNSDMICCAKIGMILFVTNGCKLIKIRHQPFRTVLLSFYLLYKIYDSLCNYSKTCRIFL